MKPSPIVSYAQNLEDIVLARALEPWRRPGTWIDIGAGSPHDDSVTKLFSNLGWSGVNVEPLPSDFASLCTDRPNDINLNVAVGELRGRADFFLGPLHSRGNSSLVAAHGIHDSSRTIEVDVVPFQDVAQNICRPVDFLKIDVEGYERQILRSIDWDSPPARILVIEATRPNSRERCDHEWRDLIPANQYEFALFDGLNCFYALRSSNLAASLAAPANIFDNYVRASQLAELAQLRETIDQLTQDMDRQEHESVEARLFISDLQKHIGLYEAEMNRAMTSISHLYAENSRLQEEVANSNLFLTAATELTRRLLEEAEIKSNTQSRVSRRTRRKSKP